MIKNYYKALVFTILTFSSLPLLAQKEEEAVKQAVTNLFNGMRTSDTALMRSVFAPGSILHTVLKNREGAVRIASTPVDSFIVSIGRPRKEVLDERISFEVLKIDGDLATVWTPYKFYVDDKLQHCGVNSFQMVRIAGAWKIQYLIDTRRRQGCE